MLAELPHDTVNPVGAVTRAAAGLAILTLLVTSGTGETDDRTWADAGAYATGTMSAVAEGARTAARANSDFDGRHKRVNEISHDRHVSGISPRQ